MKLRPQAVSESGFVTGTMMALTAGAMLQMWFGDTIDQYGLGDGLSFIICLSIMSGEPVHYVFYPGSLRVELVICMLWRSMYPQHPDASFINHRYPDDPQFCPGN